MQQICAILVDKSSKVNDSVSYSSTQRIKMKFLIIFYATFFVVNAVLVSHHVIINYFILTTIHLTAGRKQNTNQRVV